MSRVANADPIDGQGWIALFRGIIDRRVHVAFESIGVAQTEPVEVVFSYARHVELDNIATIRDLDLGLTESGGDDASECRRDSGESCASVADNGLDQCGKGSRVTVIKVGGNGELLIRRCSRNRDPQVGAVWIRLTNW